MKKIFHLLFVSFFMLLFAQQSVHAQDSAFTVINTDTIFKKVEKESEFPGGSPGWTKFLMTHLTYPSKAVKKGIQGEVVLQFIVDEKGRILDEQALSGNKLLMEAALEVIRQSPKWVPASIDGKKVKSYKKQPIIFRLEEEKKTKS